MASRANTTAPRSLSPAGVEVLELLWQHRLLDARQLKRLVAPAATDTYMRGILRELELREFVACMRMRAHGAGKVWWLTERGGDVVAAGPTKSEPRRLILTEDSASGALQAHTLAVNEVGILFVESARRRGDECGPLAWRHEIQHRISAGQGRRSAPETLQADALLTYALLLPEGRVALRYLFLEIDRATESTAVLAGKLRQYAQLFHHKVPRDREDDPLAGEPAWRLSYPFFPEVLVVLTGRPGPALERRIRVVRTLAHADPICRSTPELRVRFAILDELVDPGPFAPVFSPLAGDGARVDFLGQPSLASISPPPAGDAP